MIFHFNFQFFFFKLFHFIPFETLQVAPFLWPHKFTQQFIKLNASWKYFHAAKYMNNYWFDFCMWFLVQLSHSLMDLHSCNWNFLNKLCGNLLKQKMTSVMITKHRRMAELDNYINSKIFLCSYSGKMYWQTLISWDFRYKNQILCFKQ